jgi:hypothetical protein
METGVTDNVVFSFGLCLLAAAVPDRCTDPGPSVMHRAEIQMRPAVEQIATPTPAVVTTPAAIPTSIRTPAAEPKRRPAPDRKPSSKHRAAPTPKPSHRQPRAPDVIPGMPGENL